MAGPATALAALFAVIPRFEPRRANLERSGKAYGAVWVTVVTLLGGVHVLMVAAALGTDLHISRVVLIGTGCCSSSSATTCRRSARTT